VGGGGGEGGGVGGGGGGGAGGGGGGGGVWKELPYCLNIMMKDIQMLELKSEDSKEKFIPISINNEIYFLPSAEKVLQNDIGKKVPEKEVEILRARGDFELEIRKCP